MNRNKQDILLSPGFITALVILFINDHFLKHQYHNFLTGKISDFAGLFSLPLFLLVFFPRNKVLTYLYSSLIFVIWKLPVSDLFINCWNHYSSYTITRTVDYTDFLALSIIPLSYNYKPNKISILISKPILYFICSIALVIFCSTAGTHGSIKSYHYKVTKYDLERAVNKVIKMDSNIIRDTSNDGYNDGTDYVTFRIKEKDKINEYTIRYYGDEELWKRSLSAEIFICYAFDKNKNGGSDGNGDFGTTKLKLKKDLTRVFESVFINKINMELGMTYIDGHPE